MSCDTKVTASLGDKCNNQQGGASYFYPFPYLKDAFTVVGGEATAVNVLLTEAFSFAIAAGDANSLTQPMTIDGKIGNKVCVQTFTAQLIGNDAVSNGVLDDWAAGKSSGVVMDRNGVCYWIGADDGFDTTVVEPTTGAGINDFNGNTITTTSRTKKVAAILDDATKTAFLAIVVDPA
jgi:hypothetical protein